MQVEHINANTIRVRIDKEELAERGLKVLDLLGSKDKIQKFFYSILAEVDTDHTFAQNTPVSFQIMPNNEGLDLLISKANVANNNPNDSQSDLERLLNASQDNANSKPEQRRSFFDLNPDDDAKTDFNPLWAENDNNFASADARNDYWKFQTEHCYRFEDLGQVVALADSLRVEDLASSLYYLKGQYYLKLAFLNADYRELEPVDAWAIANEYGFKIDDKEWQSVQDIGDCIIPRDALGHLRHYFKLEKQY